MSAVSDFHFDTCGIDWLTITSHSDQDYYRMQSIFDDLVARYEPENDVSPWHWQGFAGKQSRYCAEGYREKDDLCVVMVKSEVARKAYWRFAALNGKITRLDFQVTIVLSKPVDLISRVLEIGSNKAKNVKLISGGSEVKSETLSMGNRGSRRYLKLYDKGEEEKSAGRHVKWRIEFELKGKPASEVYTSMVNSARLDDGWFAAKINQLLKDFGAVFPVWFDNFNDVSSVDMLLNSEHKSQFGDVERRLEWLSASVKPAVLKLLARGFATEVFEQLGFLDELERGGTSAARLRDEIGRIWKDNRYW